MGGKSIRGKVSSCKSGSVSQEERGAGSVSMHGASAGATSRLLFFLCHVLFFRGSAKGFYPQSQCDALSESYNDLPALMKRASSVPHCHVSALCVYQRSRGWNWEYQEFADISRGENRGIHCIHEIWSNDNERLSAMPGLCVEASCICLALMIFQDSTPVCASYLVSPNPRFSNPFASC